MAILIALFLLLTPSWIFAAEELEKSTTIVTPEFDWRAWDRLSKEEKERNVLWKNKYHPDHCEPLNEYREALNFFRVQKNDINPSEARARELAGEIANGCNGATQRFVKTFLLLKKSGVDHPRAIEYAMEFANSDDETVENFFELFKKTYLGEYFDLDYTSALRISFQLSKLYKGNRKKALEDFLEISKFCLKRDGLNLPVTQCAEVAVAMARLSQYYPDGVHEEFFRLYKALREDRRFGVSIKTALRIIREVLPFGPTAPPNFLKAYEYAIDPQGLASGGLAAIKFSVLMARHSVKEWPPPIYTPPKLPEPNLKIHEGYGLASEYKADSEQRKRDGDSQTQGH